MKYGNELISAKNAKLENYSILIKFQDGTTDRVSFEHIFSKPMNLSAEILRAGIFEKCFVQSGALAWPNGFELCPDSIYEWLHQQKKEKGVA